MSDQTQAASSPAEMADPFNGDNIALAEMNRWHASGRQELPERYKPAEPAESAPDDQPEETASEGDEPESAGDSETPKDQHQEPKKPRSAAQRIAYLESVNEKEWEKETPDLDLIKRNTSILERISAGQKRKTEPAPVAPPQAQPQQSAQQPPQKHTRPEPTMDDKNADGTPKYTDWDVYNRAVIQWNVEQGIAQFQREQAEQARAREFAARIEEDRKRFGDDFDRVITPTYNEIMSQGEIPIEFRQIVRDELASSKLGSDILHKLGVDAEAKKEFYAIAKSNPIGAIKYLGKLEALATVTVEPAPHNRNDKGQFTGQAPEPRKTTAPKPPSPVGGGSSRSFDVNDETLSEAEWLKGRNTQLKQKGKF